MQNTGWRIEWVGSFLESFRQSRKACTILPESINSVVLCWSRPDLNTLRLDVDAGFNVAKNRFSVGAGIRNDHGSVRGAAARAIRNPGSVLGAELSAIRFGMEFCLNLGLEAVCVFSDSAQAVHAINYTAVGWLPLLPILNIIKPLELRLMRGSHIEKGQEFEGFVSSDWIHYLGLIFSQTGDQNKSHGD